MCGEDDSQTRMFCGIYIPGVSLDSLNKIRIEVIIETEKKVSRYVRGNSVLESH